MSPTASRGKAGKLHRYYVSKAILTGQSDQAGTLPRIPAKAIEDLVADRLALLIVSEEFSWARARPLIKRIIVRIDAIVIELADEATTASLAERLPSGDQLGTDARAIIVPARLGRRGGTMRLLDPTGRRVVDRPEPDPALVSALAKGWRWRGQLMRGEYPTSTALAQAEGIAQTSLHRFVRLAYLAPDLQREILDGRQRPGLTLDQLCRADLPLEWSAQRRLFSARVEP